MSSVCDRVFTIEKSRKKVGPTDESQSASIMVCVFAFDFVWRSSMQLEGKDCRVSESISVCSNR